MLPKDQWDFEAYKIDECSLSVVIVQNDADDNH